MDLSTLNAIAHEGYLPKKMLVDLIKEQRYMITSLKTVTTKYGRKVGLNWAWQKEFQKLFFKMKISSPTTRTPQTSVNYLWFTMEVQVLSLVTNDFFKYLRIVTINKLKIIPSS